MTRFSATAVILFCLAFSIPLPSHSQSDRSWATDNGCFPWQDFKKGQCVAKPSQTPPPLLEPAPSPVVTAPPADAPSPPVVASPPPADIVTRNPETNVVCDGGALTNGACTCPAGFSLLPASGDASGGTCVRTNAENCLGGQLTVGGKCLCNGHVTMSGEIYLLEYSSGKCLPARCPVTASLRDGRCVASPLPQLSEPEPKTRPATREAKEAPQDPEHRQRCGPGLIYTRSGCVPA